MNRAERKPGVIEDAPVTRIPQDVSWCGRCIVCTPVCFVFECIWGVICSAFELLCSCFKGSSAPPLKERVQIDPEKASVEDEIVQKIDELTETLRTNLTKMEISDEDREALLKNWSGKNVFYPNLIRFIAATLVKFSHESKDAAIEISLLRVDIKQFVSVYISIKASSKEGYEYLQKINEREKGARSQFVGILVPPGISETTPNGQLILDPRNGLEGVEFVQEKGLQEDPNHIEHFKKFVIQEYAQSLRNSLELESIRIKIVEIIKMISPWNNRDPSLDLIGYLNQFSGLQEADNDFSHMVRTVRGPNKEIMAAEVALVAHGQEAHELLERLNAVHKALNSKFYGIIEPFQGRENSWALTFHQLRLRLPISPLG